MVHQAALSRSGGRVWHLVWTLGSEEPPKQPPAGRTPSNLGGGGGVCGTKCEQTWRPQLSRAPQGTRPLLRPPFLGV